jgi:AraC family transcriptional regulator, ethanolamine operon transcriptional activator
MIRFDDFDAWGDAISGASLQLVCDAVETRGWAIGALDLAGLVLQVAWEGGGTLCYGGNTHPGPIVFMPLTHADEHVVNGERLDDGSLLAIPSGADFRIAVRKRAHAWCSIALPQDEAGALPASAASAAIRCHDGAVPRLRRIVASITDSLFGQPGGTAAHRAAGQALEAAVLECLPARQPPLPQAGRPRLDRAEIVRRAMAMIDGTVIMPTTADLARDIGVTSRTLLRTFQESFGVPPRQYLILRELHAVRRSLGVPGADDTTVADVLTRHGIWEFGRFAARYRRQFGELPSTTLGRARG